MSLRRTVSLHALSVGIAATIGLAGTAASAAQTIAIPSYFQPTDAGWTPIWQNAPTVSLAIINPSNGIGTDTEFRGFASLAANKPAGLKVIGYVYTRRAGTAVQSGDPDRSVGGIETNIERYYTLDPGIDGIFLDEVTSSCPETYYSSIRSYMNVHHPGATLVINPGTTVQSCYLNDADIIVTFEDTFANYSADVLNVSDDPNGRNGSLNSNSSKFWHLVYATPSTSMATALGWSRLNFAGSVYVTDLGTNNGNPWGALASYFTSEVSNVGASGASSYAVTVNALDMDNGNAPITGMCVFLDGSSTCSWTPLNATLNAGSHTINMTSYKTTVFDHWDNGSTNALRTVNLSANSTFNAYYHTR
jgi:hypothetical protein